MIYKFRNTYFHLSDVVDIDGINTDTVEVNTKSNDPLFTASGLMFVFKKDRNERFDDFYTEYEQFKKVFENYQQERINERYYI